ncbi:MAG TPA: hypothetical protein VGD65_12420 [Chryseosolibacter sp.]
MTIEYRPLQGFTISGKELNWGDDREVVRKKVAMQYEADNNIIDVSIAYNGDHANDIHVKRDLYNYWEKDLSFHLNYDLKEQLESVEIHCCEAVIIKGMRLGFGEDVANVRRQLSALTAEEHETAPGEFLFPGLKATISSDEAMGGDGNGLSYFYAASNIDHLVEDLTAD